MPPFFVAAAAGAAIYAAYRFIQKESDRVSGELRSREAAKDSQRSGTFIRDPATGHYRIRPEAAMKAEAASDASALAEENAGEAAASTASSDDR